MITLRRMTPADNDAVLALEVSAEQLAFVDPLSETLSVTKDGVDNHVLEAHGEVVGFFQIHRRHDDFRR